MIHLQNLPRLLNDHDAIRFQRCASHLSLGLLRLCLRWEILARRDPATLACYQASFKNPPRIVNDPPPAARRRIQPARRLGRSLFASRRGTDLTSG
jgi:hypothetical protein